MQLAISNDGVTCVCESCAAHVLTLQFPFITGSASLLVFSVQTLRPALQGLDSDVQAHKGLPL